jgi:hypothetical protein
MPELNLLPPNLNISAIAGDDVQIVVTVITGTSGCSNTPANISSTTFAAAFKTSNATYNATTSANSTTGEVIVTWSDGQTTAAGAGNYRWWMTFTDSDITKTRLAGNFQVVSRT